MSKNPSFFSDKDGTVIAANPKRLFEMPYQLLTNPPANAIVIPASQSSTNNIMSVSGEGPIEITSLAVDHNPDQLSRAFLQIQDGQDMRGLMNRSVHIDTIFGTGPRPYLLPEALFVDERRSVIATFTDISNVTNTVRILMNAARYLQPQMDPQMKRIRDRMANRQYLSLPFWYTLDQSDVNQAGAVTASGGGITLGVGATGTFSITVGQDSHFDIFQITAVATSPDFDINIVDSSRGESLIDAPQQTNFPIAAGLVIGNAQFPYRLIEPYFVQLRTKLIVTLVNRSGAPNVIHLTLGGRILANRMWQ